MQQVLFESTKQLHKENVSTYYMYFRVGPMVTPLNSDIVLCYIVEKMLSVHKIWKERNLLAGATKFSS